MNKFFKRLALVLVIVMALVMIPVSLAAADPLPADADPAVWDTISLTRADGTSLVEGTDYTVTKGKYSHYAYFEPFTYNIYNVTTSDPIVISGGAAYKNSSLTYPLKSRITLGADVTSVTLKDVTALGELSVTEGSNVDFTLAGENYVDKILGTGLTTTITFGGEGSLTGEHIGGVDKYGADPATNVGCNIVINSGTFNITAGYKSAIGGGQYGNSGKITINGGNITAKSNYGAAIGGGQNGSATEIVITDGEINATGSFGAAIGGGQLGGAENISISGGTIEAKGSHVGAAIGGGQDGDVGTVEITDGDITVIARSIGIGGQDAENISISGGNIELKKLNSSSQEIPADAGMIGAANGSTDAVEISGGSFNVELPEDYLAEGTEIKKNEDGTYGVNEKIVVMVDSTGYKSLADAIANATPDANGTIIYEIYGKATVDSTGWIQVARAGLTGLTKVEFVGKTSDAEICITGGLAILADQKYDIDVSFEALTLSKLNPTYGGDYGHSTNYFTTWLRNTNAAENTVTYTNCTFPNGLCNNQYGKTVVDGCTFSNTTAKLYNFWNYSNVLDGETTGVANTEIKNSTFTGVRGIKIYSEKTHGGEVLVSNTTFDGLTEKAAIVTSKPVAVTVKNVSVSGDKGFFTRDITGNDEVMLKVAGTGISGIFNITSDTNAEAAKEEFNISAGTFTSEVSSDYLADGFELKDNGNGTYGVKAASVAKIGTVEYASLDDAIKAAKDGNVIVVSAGEYTLNGSLTYTGKAFTIKAAVGVKVSFDMSAAVALHGAKIIFDGVTFDYKTNGNYIGLQHADTLVYNSCTINGMVFLYATNETFNGCTFIQTSAGAYNVWTYGAKNVKFNGCVFNCVGKSVLLYNEGANTGTDLTVTDTTFNASAPVAGKAAIEIDTSLMGGQSKITVDKATADKTTGFGSGSNSGNSLWNDKANEKASDNENVTVVVADETVYEPAIIDLDTFIKKLVASGYNFDGKLKNGGKLTVKWSPVTGCYDTRAGHTCTVNGVTATGNTPKRVNNSLTQFQLFEGSDVAVIIKNVKFVYEPAAFTVCENSGWKGSFTAEQAPAGQLYFMTTGDVTVDSCDFEKVVFTTFNTTGTSIVKDCTFKDVYNNYAIKDIRGENVSVTGTTIENCGGGIMVSSTGAVSNVTITGNTFKNVDAAGTAAADKVGTRAILQIASLGKYENTAFVFSGNTATSCGPVIRQLNTTVAPVGSSLKYLTESPNSASGLYTSDSEVSGYIKDENGNVTISTAEGLFWFAKQVNSGNNFAGKTVKLANDIDLNNELWTPIGIYDDSKTHFKGTFDGQNHIVSGLNVVESRKNGVGFFGKVYTGTIKNLTVEGNITAYGCNYVGGIIGHGYATITNCTFRGNVGSNTTMQVGGIAGSGGFTVTNCSVYGKVIAECWAGGIVGNCQDGGAYTNCYIEGEISAERTYWGGGAAGITPVPLYPSQVISGCYSNTVVKVAGEEVNCPIIAAYNNPLDYNGYTGDLKIYDNSWNKQKNSNDSYPIYAEKNGVGGVLAEGKTVSRDNNLIMLEDDLKYVEGDLSAVRIMAGSAVTQEQVDALAMAQIGDRKYTSLDTAIAAAKDGDTVTLLADVTADVVITANKSITLDLNGKTLNGGTGNTKATITNYGTITITDSSAEKTGTIKRDDNGTEGETSYYVIRNFGTMTIEQANIINNSGYKKTNPSGSMVGSSLICNGDDDAYSAVLNIKGGTIRQDNFIAIKNGSSATLNVTGGKITSKHSAVQNWCNANITGGELNGQLWTDSWDSNSTGNTVMGGDAKFTGEIVIDITGSIVPKFEITGGTLDVTNWRITTEAANAGAKPAVSGGTFTSAVPEEYCAEGFIPTKNADGTYGVKAGKYVAKIGDVKYETLIEAFAAAKNGDTITLLADVELSSAIEIQKGKTITLDLNGKKLSTDLQPGGTKHYYAIDNYGTFTLRDSSAEQSGEIRARGIENLETGTMTIESGKIVAIDTNGGAAIWNNANLTINGGTFVAEHVGASSDQFGPGCVYNDGTLTINGGTFMSANKRTYAIVSKAGTVTITPADGKNVTISGAHGGLGIDGGTAIINGGSYASDDYYGLYVSNDAGTADVTVNGGTFTGNKYSVLIGSDGSSSVTSTLKINGGTFDMPIHAQENTTDGAIVISGGKFKFKVDDKYFKDGFACSTDTTGGYYTVKGHPITNMGLSIGEGLSLRIYLLDGTTTGKLRVTYTKPDGEEVSYIIDETEFELVGNEENGYTEKYFFRIFNITPQMADMTITVQYIGEDGKDFGSAKEVSILKYCEGYIAKYPTENVKTFVSKLLEYCASAMDYVAIKYSEQVYNGKTWTERATALRAEKERLCGTDVPTFDFKELGTNSKFGRKIFDTNGIIFGESLTFYLGIRKENYNPDYHYIPTGSNETKPVFDEKSGEYRFYFTMAPYEYNTSMRIVVKSGNSTICERATSLDFLLNKYSAGDSAAARFCKAAYEYCRALEAVIKDINK